MILALVLSAVLIFLGALGIFFGSKFNFALPPIFGGLPLLFGLGIAFPIWNWYKFYRITTKCVGCGKERYGLAPGKYQCSCGIVITVDRAMG
jgi:hypothetical protein